MWTERAAVISSQLQAGVCTAGRGQRQTKVPGSFRRGQWIVHFDLAGGCVWGHEAGTGESQWFSGELLRVSCSDRGCPTAVQASLDLDTSVGYSPDQTTPARALIRAGTVLVQRSQDTPPTAP